MFLGIGKVTAKAPTAQAPIAPTTKFATMSAVFSTKVYVEHYFAPYLGVSCSTFSLVLPYQISLLNRECSKKFATKTNCLCAFLLSTAKIANKVIYQKGSKEIDIYQTIDNVRKINLWRFIITGSGKVARTDIIEQTVAHQPFLSEIQIYDTHLKRSMPLILQIIRFGNIDLIRLCLDKNKNYKIGKIEMGWAERRTDNQTEKSAILELLRTHNSKSP